MHGGLNGTGLARSIKRLLSESLQRNLVLSRFGLPLCPPQPSLRGVDLTSARHFKCLSPTFIGCLYTFI